MQYEEYKQQVNNLEKEFEQKKIELIKYYVNSNNPYKIGDNVTDHMGTIQIEKITYGFSTISKIPCAIYRGIELKKDGSPKKQNRRDVWQTNLIN